MSENDTGIWRSVVWRLAVAVLVFGGSAAIVMTLRLPGTPSAESDRWAVAMAVAAFLGGLTISALEWSRRRGESGEAGSPSGNAQRIRTGRDSDTIVASGDVNATGTPAPRSARANTPRRSVDQRVKSGRRSRTIVAGGDVVVPPEEKK